MVQLASTTYLFIRERVIKLTHNAKLSREGGERRNGAAKGPNAGHQARLEAGATQERRL